jgi:hypothetical protein
MTDHAEDDADEGSMTVSTELPIETLIRDRSRMLGLSRFDIVRRAGFKNVAKGLRRLDGLCAGDTKSTASLICGLPAALNLPAAIIDNAIHQTVQQIEAATRIAELKRDAKWRAEFRPSAYLLGTDTRPSQIVIYGVTGGSERWLNIPLDLSRPAVTFARQALAVARRTPIVPVFGPTTGFVVNYKPNFAVRFNMGGKPVEAFDRAYSPGPVTITMDGKEISAKVFAKVVGLMPEAGAQT